MTYAVVHIIRCSRVKSDKDMYLRGAENLPLVRRYTYVVVAFHDREDRIISFNLNFYIIFFILKEYIMKYILKKRLIFFKIEKKTFKFFKST